jgi:hypothetical protein
VGLTLLNVYCNLIESDLGLKGALAEAGIAVVASLVQAAELWFTASLIGFGRFGISSICVGIIYWLSHLNEWNGYEVGGILLFQMVVGFLGFLFLAGMFKVAIMVLVVFILCLAVMASILRSL